ncbi:general secretion pathway protein GspK [Pedobacter metabolipauper]|uniref:Helix-hairpin-helix protein n=1 Tax=Pedobacter metabolipauper TaxID=425513 RepID=A0A4R6SYK6_9SPHI|nr:general secretion pathway protein GspK [Pedobacter metabolipauper]TDQ11147.1 hypothetical protein ATK78_0262 [Pedobacter metabolipauper]
MPNTKIIAILLIMMFLFLKARAQEEDVFVKELIEAIAESLPEDYDLSEIAERLNYHIKNPINLNKTNRQELNDLIFLSALQISNLFNHLTTNGKLLDLLELQGIEGFDSETIKRLLPFVTLKIPSELSGKQPEELFIKGNHDLIFRYGRILETQKGFTNLPGSKYQGTPEKLLFKYKYSFSNTLSATLIAEKDAGEYLLSQKTGADHISGNIGIGHIGKIEKLILGDYSLQFGQGLTLWSGFAFGKGSDVTSVAAKDGGIKPYSSANEVSFFRGAAATIAISNSINYTSFISFRKLDASLTYTEDHNPTLQNITLSGLHRTQNELKNQKTLKQLIYGVAVQYTKNNLQIGLIGYHTRYQHEFITGTQAYNRYGFTGNRLTNGGIHYNYTYRNMYLYAEAAHSLTSGWAVVNAAMISLSKTMSMIMLYRNYAKDYHNFYSNGIGEGSEINNERGWYMGLNYAASKRWTYSIYCDYFKFPWLKYRIDSPSSGYETLGQIAYTPTKTFKLILCYKKEIKQQNADDDSQLEQVKKQTARIECNWKLDKKFNFQQRLELSEYQKGKLRNEIGCLIYSDINYKPMSAKLSANMRIACFATPSYNSRIYAYEDNVLYGASSGIYSGKGIRTFINLRYRLNKQIDLWTRYGIYLYSDVASIGSGLDEIKGNKKSAVNFQIRYQL